MSICGTCACVVPTKPDTMAAATPAAAAAFRIAGLDAGLNVALDDLPSAQDAATRAMRCSVDCPDDPVPRHQHDLVLGRGQCQSTKGEKVARDGRCNEGAADCGGLLVSLPHQSNTNGNRSGSRTFPDGSDPTYRYRRRPRPG